MGPNFFQYLILLTALVFVILGIVVYRGRKNSLAKTNKISEADLAEQLEENVPFYARLDEVEKKIFQHRVQVFLSKVRITPVAGAQVTATDKVLVAAAGIIPLFRFRNWFYNNLDEVLLYPDRFGSDFAVEGNDRPIAGMVGDGFMHRSMVLSLPYLRAGFDKNSEQNTGIHEFVHLLDKSDGATDGIPESILNDDNVKPWITLMASELQDLRIGNSILDPYGATSMTEFFAVASEFFFQDPQQLKESHPELHEMMEKAFVERL